MKIHIKKLHHEDKSVIITFIDAVRLKNKISVTHEILARYVAEHIKINPDVSNAKLANKFASLLEAGLIK